MTAIDTPRLEEATSEHFNHEAVGDLAAAISGLMAALHRRRVVLTPHSSVKGPVGSCRGALLPTTGPPFVSRQSPPSRIHTVDSGSRRRRGRART